MPFNSASHFNVSGAGIDGVIDIASVSGEGTVSLTVDGRALRDPCSDHGLVRSGRNVRGIAHLPGESTQAGAVPG